MPLSLTGGPSELFGASKLVLNARHRLQPPLESLLVCGDINRLILATELERQSTTARANQTTGLTNGRAVN